MARILPDASVEMDDDRILEPEDFVVVSDMPELVALFAPIAPPRVSIVPSGGSGFQGSGGRGPAGARGPEGAQGPQGPSGSGGGWTDDGTVVRLTTATDQVAIGAAVPFGTEKVAIVGDTIITERLAVGATSFVGGETALFRDDQNAATFARVRNATNDTMAEAQFVASASTPTLISAVMGATSALYTPTLGRNAGEAYFTSDPSTTPIAIITTGVAPIRFVTNSVEAMRINQSQQVLIGATTPVATELLRVAGAVQIDGKLTVVGAIDPTSVLLSGGTALFYESNDGSTAPVSGAATGRIRYNNSTATWQISVQGGAYASIATGSGSGGGWVDDGTVVRLDTSTDDVVVGGVTSIGKFGVVGDTTGQVTAALRAVAAQTVDILQLQSSTGAVGIGAQIVSGATQFDYFRSPGDASPSIQMFFTGAQAQLRMGDGTATPTAILSADQAGSAFRINNGSLTLADGGTNDPTLAFHSYATLTAAAGGLLEITGASFRINSGFSLQFTSDVSLTRGSADRLDLASGDSFYITSGGSVSVPAVAISDTNTGIYVGTSNVLSITTAGVERANFQAPGADSDTGMFLLIRYAGAVLSLKRVTIGPTGSVSGSKKPLEVDATA